MMEESLNAAQDAVADRLYSPMILATLGLDNLGDGEPWIPDANDLDNLRDDMQTALSADFKLMCHNQGLTVTSVFGRESVPRFDQDYERVDAKLLQAWGIGEALIAGGSGGAYASSALNREVCEQLMFGFQNKVKRHILKRMEIIAEAQEHYDYELKGGYRRPLYREIVQTDPDTGEERVVRVPKLKLPDVHFETLNLRDESTERAFVGQLKAAGVPISDGRLSVNIPIEFDQELERSAEETVKKMLADAQSMAKTQKLCDQQGLPYPPQLSQELAATLQLRTQLAQTEQIESQTKMMQDQMKAQSPGGQMGAFPPPPGSATPPTSPAEGSGTGNGTVEDAEGGVPAAGAPTAPGPETNPVMPDSVPEPPVAEVARNRQRPEESDEMRANSPRAAKKNRGGIEKKSKFELGPSSYGRSRGASEARVERAVRRREIIAGRGFSDRVEDLVNDPKFYDALNMQSYESQLQADFPEILNGGALESKRILDDMLESYSHIFGVDPQW